MKLAAILLNIGFPSYVLYIFYVQQAYPDHTNSVHENPVAALFMICTPIFSLIALIFDNGNSWLSLFLKRKTLEEKIRLETLQKSEK